MEKLVAELKKKLPLKDTAAPGDIVIIAALKPAILHYAVIKDIQRDDSRKAEWWHVSMNILSVPIQEVTWTLRTPQFTGQEIFTMGGEGRFIQALDLRQGQSGKLSEKKQTKSDGKNKLRVVK